MNPFTFSRLFPRKPAVRPATAQVHTDAAAPLWRDITPLPPDSPPPGLDFYAKKKREPAAPPLPDLETGFVISLSCERQLRLSRLLRHGYQLGTPARAANVVPWRRAA